MHEGCGYHAERPGRKRLSRFACVAPSLRFADPSGEARGDARDDEIDRLGIEEELVVPAPLEDDELCSPGRPRLGKG